MHSFIILKNFTFLTEEINLWPLWATLLEKDVLSKLELQNVTNTCELVNKIMRTGRPGVWQGFIQSCEKIGQSHISQRLINHESLYRTHGENYTKFITNENGLFCMQKYHKEILIQNFIAIAKVIQRKFSVFCQTLRQLNILEDLSFNKLFYNDDKSIRTCYEVLNQIMYAGPRGWNGLLETLQNVDELDIHSVLLQAERGKKTQYCL